MPLKILNVVGARPQFIKAGAVSRVMARRSDMTEIMLHTGQHSDDDMSGVFFRELDIDPPQYELNISGGSHGEMTGRMIVAIERALLESKPDWVIVYGDTNSTLAGALTAAKLNIPVMHVEAGLRSFNPRMPEEVNRILTDHISTLLMCPTHRAVANLEREGIIEGVHHVGDVMYDATLFAAGRARKESPILNKLGLTKGNYAVVTVHRPANTDNPEQLRAIVKWLAERATEHKVVFPLHPRTRDAIAKSGINMECLMTIEPLGHLDMTRLIDDAVAVYTDSGGLQKEAYFHGKPCVTLRAETEWVELVECGWNRLWSEVDYRPRKPITDFGDGHAAERILDCLAASS